MSDAIQERAKALLRDYDDLDAPDLVRVLSQREFSGRIALVSSFGAESALLLALAADVDTAFPILFVDTGKMFPETIDYRDRLTAQLGLTGVRTIEPSSVALNARDPHGQLWRFDPDACCQLRKVEPLAAHLDGFDAVISGRKRYHGATRRFLPRIEAVDGRIKIDPLAHWSRERVEAEFRRRELPDHPLKALGYPSIGCMPCTAPVGENADIRAGRWAGSVKTECGIHLTGAAGSAVSAAL